MPCRAEEGTDDAKAAVLVRVASAASLPKNKRCPVVRKEEGAGGGGAEPGVIVTTRSNFIGRLTRVVSRIAKSRQPRKFLRYSVFAGLYYSKVVLCSYTKTKKFRRPMKPSSFVDLYQKPSKSVGLCQNQVIW